MTEKPTAMQEYFNDVKKRLGYTDNTISQMCGKINRTTVTKWLRPYRQDISRNSLIAYRQSLQDNGMYEEMTLFDRAFNKTYSEGMYRENDFDSEYVRMEFSERLDINRQGLPECLYNEADVYHFTEYFPDLKTLEMIAATERYRNLTAAVDNILPGMSQIELLRFQKTYETRIRIMEEYGLSPDLITTDIMEFSCIPQTIADIPDKLKQKVFMCRLSRIYGLDLQKDVQTLLNVMSMCTRDGLVILPHKISENLTGSEVMEIAVSDFIFSYLHDMQLQGNQFHEIFNVSRVKDESVYKFILTEKGVSILQCCYPEP